MRGPDEWPLLHADLGPGALLLEGQEDRAVAVGPPTGHRLRDLALAELDDAAYKARYLEIFGIEL